MPKICEFYGISISLYHREHGPPHFHARHDGREVRIAIEDLSVLSGSISPRAMGMVVEWAALRRDELRCGWRQAREHQPIDRIEPLG